MTNTQNHLEQVIKTRLEEDVKTARYHRGPIPQIKGPETVYFCPICTRELEVFHEGFSPDDYRFVANCNDCDETWEE